MTISFQSPKQNRQHLAVSGFTLVELLIVIVVIAILAAISVVAYNGIQGRAHFSKIAASIDATVKILEMIKIDQGSYPLSNGRYYCIGTAENYPERAPFSAGTCTVSTGQPGYVDVDFNNLLLEYASAVPDGSTPPTTEGSYSERGITYFASALMPGKAYLTYRIVGDYECPRGENRGWYAGMTTCEVTLTS